LATLDTANEAKSRQKGDSERGIREQGGRSKQWRWRLHRREKVCKHLNAEIILFAGCLGESKHTGRPRWGASFAIPSDVLDKAAPPRQAATERESSAGGEACSRLFFPPAVCVCDPPSMLTKIPMLNVRRVCLLVLLSHPARRFCLSTPGKNMRENKQRVMSVFLAPSGLLLLLCLFVCF